MPADNPSLQESHVHATSLQESGFPASTGPLPAAVLWDLDGTLIDSEKVWDVSLADTIRWLGGELSPRTRAAVVGLLEPGRIGVELSEELQLHPEQSTDALVAHHPEAKYFNAG